MSSTQRAIKYCAIAFAALLAVGIISSIASVAFAVINGITGETNVSGHWNGKTVDYSQNFMNVESLDISNATGELKIRIGNEFKVEAENVSENFKADVNGNGKLTISDDHNGVHFLWFNSDGFSGTNSKVTLYVPAEFVAKETKIDTGAGNVSLEGLQSEYLYISAGAGKISGSDLTADEMKMDGGVGTVDFSNVDFTDTDIECGVGSLNVEGTLLGKTKIECGVGEVDLDLNGNVNDYGFKIESGIGPIKVNGKKISGTQESNSGADNYIEVEGGVGSVKIDFKE